MGSRIRGDPDFPFTYEVTLRFIVRTKKRKDLEEVGESIFSRFADVPLENGIVSKGCETKQVRGRRLK